MSGLWMILLFGLLPDELLPAPKTETLPKPLLVASNMEPQVGTVPSGSATTLPSIPSSLGTIAAEDCKVGWGTDPTDRSMYLVIQIAPKAIAQFATGTQAMELESIIPPALRGRVQKVIIRVGSGPVEQSPPESELARLPAPYDSSNSTYNAPTIANLDRRAAVNIDPPPANRETTRSNEASIVSTAGTTQLPVVPGLNLPASSSIPSGTLPTYPNEVYPTTPSASLTNPSIGGPILSTPIPSTAPATTTSAPTWNNNTGTTTSSIPTNTYGQTTIPNDGFAAMPKTVPNTLNPFGTNRVNSPTTGTPATGTPTAGAMTGNNRVVPATTTSGTTTQGNVTYSSSGTSGLGTGYSNVPHMANNPNGYNYPTTNGYNNPPPGGYVLPNDPAYAQYANQYNPAQYNVGTQIPTAPVLPIPQVATRPLPSTAQSNHSATDSAHRPVDPNYQSRGTLLPFFLVLSFILNIYFGLWLNHLSTKYRHLLGNVRGLATSETV